MTELVSTRLELKVFMPLFVFGDDDRGYDFAQNYLLAGTALEINALLSFDSVVQWLLQCKDEPI